MRRLIVAFCLWFGAAAWAMPVTVTRVVDGDTLQIDAALWLMTAAEGKRLHAPVLLRLRGVDTPELRAATACERALAVKAREFVAEWVAAGPVEAIVSGLDTYRGRVDGELLRGGEALADRLIAAGLARPYSGAVARAALGPWC